MANWIGRASPLYPARLGKIPALKHQNTTLRLNNGIRLSEQVLLSQPFSKWSSLEQSYFLTSVNLLSPEMVSLTTHGGISLGFLTPKSPELIAKSFVDICKDPEGPKSHLDSIFLSMGPVLLPQASRLRRGDHIVVLENGRLSPQIASDCENWAPYSYYSVADAFMCRENLPYAIAFATRAVRAVSEEALYERVGPEKRLLQAQIYAYQAALFVKYAHGLGDEAPEKAMMEKNAHHSALHALDFDPTCAAALHIHHEITGSDRAELKRIINQF